MYYWQYVKNGLIDQKLRTVQTIIHNHSWYFCLFSGNEGDFWIGGIYDSLRSGWNWLKNPTAVSRSHFGVPDNQMVIRLVPVCGEKQPV